MERVNFHSDLKRSVLCNLLVIYIVALVSVKYFESQLYINGMIGRLFVHVIICTYQETCVPNPRIMRN